MIRGLINIANSDNSLRPYQIESKKEIYEAWLSVRSVLFQMPTGTGKTRLFASIIKDVRTISIAKAIIPQPRILVLAHRTELIEQISNTITNKYHITCGIIKSGILENMDAMVQVASVQSLTRRLARWGTIPFGLIVIDEAHHALAKTYLKICSAFPYARILGVTATPCRLNGESFRKIFDKLIVSPSVQSFIEMGYLSRFQYYSIKPTTQIQYDIDSIKYFGANGDYAERELMDICDRTQVRAQLIKSYNQYAKGKKGIIYTINKTHNKHVAQQYKDIGVSVATIDSDTPAEERRQIVFDFRNGKYDIICNVNIFSEGFDCPDIEFIQLARPTLSLSLYLQQVGRALRISDNKAYALILDNVGSYNKFGLPNKPIDWNRYFKGIGSVVPNLWMKESVTTSKEQKPISEADEAMILISETISTITDNALDHPTYTIRDICTTFEQFPIGHRDYLHRKEIMALQTKGDATLVESVRSLYDDFSERYVSMERYIEGAYNDLDMEYEDEISRNILENTYLFNTNGKYGVCRLKLGYNMIDIVTEVINTSSAIQPSKYFEILLEPELDKIYVPNSKDCFIAVNNGLYGVIDGSNFTEIIRFEYDEIIETGFIYSEYIVEKAGKLGVLNKDGEIRFPIKYDNIYYNFNGSYTFEEDGKYFVIQKENYTSILDVKVKQLTDSLSVCCQDDNKNILYLTDHSGNILFPLGACQIFLTNNENEICLEFVDQYLLLNMDLSFKTSIINGKHPDREAIFKVQRENQKKERQLQENKTKHVAQPKPIIKEDKTNLLDEVIPTAWRPQRTLSEPCPSRSKKKRPRIIRKTTI